MRRKEILARLEMLHDQVHQTAERMAHLPERLPMEIEPQSLNYDRDLSRFQGEYNRLVREAQAEGLLSAADLEEYGLPEQFEG